MSSYGIDALVIAGCMVSLWLLSLKLRDASIVDIFWGSGFVIVAWVTFFHAGGGTTRALLVPALVSAWGLRLSAYLLWRNHGRGEDPRYVAMRARHGAKWPLRSLFIVFGLQGALMWLISLPVQHAVRASAPAELGALDWLGVALVVVGVFFEATGDWQLARFKANPANKGKVMDQGLWRYTRHPNYFGDFVTWWGLFCFAAAVGSWWTVVGPIVMSTLLMRVSGVPLTEKGMRGRPGFDEYLRRTSSFFPRPPRA